MDSIYAGQEETTIGELDWVPRGDRYDVSLAAMRIRLGEGVKNMPHEPEVEEMRVTAKERETGILFNDAEDMAKIYTSQPEMMQRLSKHPQAKLIHRHEDEWGEVISEQWEFPKALFSISGH